MMMTYVSVTAAGALKGEEKSVEAVNKIFSKDSGAYWFIFPAIRVSIAVYLGLIAIAVAEVFYCAGVCVAKKDLTEKGIL